MFGRTKYRSKQVSMAVLPGKLDLGVAGKMHDPLTFEDLKSALYAGIDDGAESVAFKGYLNLDPPFLWA